ncbi:MAG: DUF5020 family protein [Bacteroidales bacterium]|nr:DUF5020 family protein [Bacteroidales bacterium]
MRKVILLFFIMCSLTSTSQNLQLHYDLGSDRKYFTSTIEMFKPDKLGSTFFFIDMDYGSNGVKGVSMAYWEIARVFKTEKMPIGIHAEFDGGFGAYNTGDINHAYEINNAGLLGIDYSLTASDFSKGISFKVLYKYISGKHDASYQFATVWFYHFWKQRMTFSGFADFWREDFDFNFDGNVDAEYVFLAEPQLWYHINDHFSFGGEVEFSNNFGGHYGHWVRPTVALKWTF